MPALKASSSISIDAPQTEVMTVVSDFNSWPSWSPWLYIEPDARVTVHGQPGETGHGYDWQGEATGAGGMKIRSLSSNEMQTDLHFLKPFKSQADVRFLFEAESPDRTRVTWTMDSKLPFFMFFMTRKMAGMIKNDYMRGLRLLKDVIETGEHHSETERMGLVQSDEFEGVALGNVATIATLSEVFPDTFARLHALVSEAGLQVDGPPIACYDDLDMATGAVRFRVAVPVEGAARMSNLGELERLILPARPAMKVVHKGPYRHLGNAWFDLMSTIRQQRSKPSKTVPPWEVYLDAPDTVHENELRTAIYQPLRQ